MKLPTGRWEVSTISDDGVKVWIDGELVLENWTQHGPNLDTATFEVVGERPVKIVVAHFELNGFATLHVFLHPVD